MKVSRLIVALLELGARPDAEVLVGQVSGSCLPAQGLILSERNGKQEIIISLHREDA